VLERSAYPHKVFKSLFENEEQIRNSYIKTQCREILTSCDTVKNKHEKGKLFERLTEIIFTSNNFFELVDKRVNTGDEEIDLVVKNNIDKPFWNALQSPLFFIECKNWINVVGTKELRDFEGKLRNHAKLVKVGFFVSINGFSSEVANELKRGSRGDQHVVLLDRSNIEDYLSSKQEFFSWIEKQTTTFY